MARLLRLVFWAPVLVLGLAYLAPDLVPAIWVSWAGVAGEHRGRTAVALALLAHGLLGPESLGWGKKRPPRAEKADF